MEASAPLEPEVPLLCRGPRGGLPGACAGPAGEAAAAPRGGAPPARAEPVWPVGEAAGPAASPAASSSQLAACSCWGPPQPPDSGPRPGSGGRGLPTVPPCWGCLRREECCCCSACCRRFTAAIA